MKVLGTFIAIVLFLVGAGLVGCSYFDNVRHDRLLRKVAKRVDDDGTTWRPDLDPAISAPGKL